MQNRCINIDWLEVYALEPIPGVPRDANYFREKGYQIEERDYGTRVWAEMFTLKDWHDEPWIEVRRNPKSQKARNGGLFPMNAVHLRLSNRACYGEAPITLLRQFMVDNGYEMGKIFRLDIALDFEHFDLGDDPAKFIERYMHGKYAKINQSNISAHGVDTWAGRTWNSLSWGQSNSMVSTKMYCKTLELKQAKDKPYIRYTWFVNGLVDDWANLTKRDEDGNIYTPAIWRVEFSIKSAAQRVFIINRADGKKRQMPIPHTLDMYDTPEKLITIFASLAQHYFRFKYYEEGVRKDRCKDKVLFRFSPRDFYYKIDRLASHSANTKPAERLLVLLANYATLHPSQEIIDIVKKLSSIIETNNLREMLEHGTLQLQVRALQIVMQQRLQGHRRESVTQQIEEVLKYLDENPNLF